MSLEALSQILAVAGVSSFQEEFILIAFRKLSTSPHPEQGLESSLKSSCLSTKDIDDPCTKSDVEHSAEPEIEEISPCLATSFVCIPETNYPRYSSMTEEDIQSGPNEETSQYTRITSSIGSRLQFNQSITLIFKYSSHHLCQSC